MQILVGLVMLTSMTVMRAGAVAAPVLSVLGAVLAGYAGWHLTDRLIAWRQNAD